MSAQLLVLESLLRPSTAPSIQWTIDRPAQGVAILDVAVGGVASTAPLHWRAGDWSKPPLDVRLSDRGVLESIQLVFQDESIEVGEGAIPSESTSGLPVFDVQAWPEGRYSDAREDVETVRLSTGELYAAIGGARPAQSVLVGEGLRLLVDSIDRLVGMVLGPLARDEWLSLEDSAPRK